MANSPLMLEFLALKHPMLVHVPVGAALLLPLALIAAQRPGRGIKPWWITCRYLAWTGLLGLLCAMLSGWLWARHQGLIPQGKLLAPHLLKPTAEQWLQVTIWKHQMAASVSVVLGLLTLMASYRKRQEHQGLGLLALFFGLLWCGASLTAGYFGGQMTHPALGTAPVQGAVAAAAEPTDPEMDAPLRALDYGSLEPMHPEPVRSTTHGNRWIRVWVTPSGSDAYRAGKPLPPGAFAVMTSLEDRWGRPSFESGPLYMLETLADGKPSLAYYWPRVPEAKRGETGGEASAYWRGKNPNLETCMGCHYKGQAPLDERSTWRTPRRVKPEGEATSTAPTE
ncbi:MAG: hypothetical protein IPQ13_10120 [Holophagaceae bacterium]|nr:hypothetical protein [Holophagaceae bacterium]